MVQVSFNIVFRQNRNSRIPPGLVLMIIIIGKIVDRYHNGL